MFQKLETIETRCMQLDKLLSDADVIKDQKRFQQYAKERSDLSELLDTYRSYKKVCSELEESEHLSLERDEELKQLAKAEAHLLREEKGKLEESLNRAGFDVVGVDINPQPHYPFAFIRADAMTFPLYGFDAIHASPPCQAYAAGPRNTNLALKRAYQHPRLIEPMRERFAGVLHVIENVESAPLINPTRLCGTSFGLPLRRHRLFESPVLLLGLPCRHDLFREPRYWTGWTQGGRGVGNKRRATTVQVYGHAGERYEWPAAMGIDWMTIAQEGRVYLGADTAETWGCQQYSVPTKLWTHAGFVFGATGCTREGQIIEHRVIPARNEGIDLMRWLVNDFTDAIRTAKREAGYEEKSTTGVEQGPMLLFGVAGRLFTMASSFAISEHVEFAMGSGAAVALGSLHTQRNTLSVCVHALTLRYRPPVHTISTASRPSRSCARHAAVGPPFAILGHRVPNTNPMLDEHA